MTSGKNCILKCFCNLQKEKTSEFYHPLAKTKGPATKNDLKLSRHARRRAKHPNRCGRKWVSSLGIVKEQKNRVKEIICIFYSKVRI